MDALIVEVTGYLAGFFLMMSLLPQVVRSARTRKTKDISWGMLWCTFLSGGLYEIYALQLQLIPVVVMNGVFLLLSCVLICLKFRFDRRDSGIRSDD